MIIITGRTTKNDITVTRIDSNRYRITVYCVKGSGGGGDPLTPETLGSCIESCDTKRDPVDADNIVLHDSEDSNIAKKYSWFSVKSFFATLFAALNHTHSGVYDPTGTATGIMSTHNSSYAHASIHATNVQFNKNTPAEISALSDKSTPGNDDVILMEDSGSSPDAFSKVKLTWANLKTALGSIFSSVNHNHAMTYSAIGHNHSGVYSPVAHNHTDKITIGITIDGQGGIPTTGSKGFRVCEVSGTIANWYVVGDVSGAIQFDLKRSGSSIVGAGNKPLLNAAQRSNAAPANWTSTAIAANDELEFVVDSASTLTRATLFIQITKTI